MRKLVVAAALATSAIGTAAVAQTTPPAPATAPSGLDRGMGAGMGMGMMRADASGDGVVTRVEATAQADAQFDAMDANRDGKVTGDEMRAAFAARAGVAGGGRGKGGRGGFGGGDMSMTRDDFRAHALARFDWNDTNHDGKVDAAEMAAARQMRMNRGGDAPAAPQQ